MKNIITLVFVSIVTVGACQQFQPLWLIQWEQSQKNGYVPVTSTFSGQSGVQVYHLLDSIVFSDTPNYYYVSPYGNDAIARVGDPSRPWRTPWSASADAENHSVIIVSPGKYSQGAGLDFTGAANLAGKEHTYIFAEGAEVYYTAGPLFNLENNPVYGTSVYGRARFESLSANSGRFFSSGSGSPNGNKAFLQAKSIIMGGSGNDNDAFAFLRNNYDITVILDSLTLTGEGKMIAESGTTPTENNRLVVDIGVYRMDETLNSLTSWWQLGGDNAEYQIHIGQMSFTMTPPGANQTMFDLLSSNSNFNSSVYHIQIDSGNWVVNSNAHFCDIAVGGTGSNNIIDLKLGTINMTGNGNLTRGADSDIWGSGSTVSIHADKMVKTGSGRMFFSLMSTTADHLAQYNISGNWTTTAGVMIFLGDQIEIEFSGKYEITGSGTSLFACVGSGNLGAGDIVFSDVTIRDNADEWISTDDSTFLVTYSNVEWNEETRSGRKINPFVFERGPHISVEGTILEQLADTTMTAQFLTPNMNPDTKNEIRVGHDIDAGKNYAALRFHYIEDDSTENKLLIDVSKTTQGDLIVHGTGQLQAPSLFDSAAVRKVYKDNDGLLWSSETAYGEMYIPPNDPDTLIVSASGIDTLTDITVGVLSNFSISGTSFFYDGNETKSFLVCYCSSAESAAVNQNMRYSVSVNSVLLENTRQAEESVIAGDIRNVCGSAIISLSPGDEIQLVLTFLVATTVIVRGLNMNITEI